MTNAIDRLKDYAGNPDLFDRRVIAGNECYDLTDAGAELAESLGLSVDVDAYGCAYVVWPEAQ